MLTLVVALAIASLVVFFVGLAVLQLEYYQRMNDANKIRPKHFTEHRRKTQNGNWMM